MKVQTASIDWLTMTTKEGSVGQKWYDVYRKYKAVRRKEGNEEKPFHNGYYGGTRIHKMSVGHSDAIGYIVVVSGQDANRLFYRLTPGKHSTTRLDLCIDFLFDRPVKLADDLFARQSQRGSNKQRKYSIFSNSEGGKTFYLGSRSSAQYGRMYDKGVEAQTAEPGHLWRAEVEYKKPKAGFIANQLAELKSEDRAMAICDTVTLWFAERGAELFPVGSTAQAMHILAEERVTTAERKMAWLRSQVQPSVTELIAAGYGKKVLFVLGLEMEVINKALIGDN